MSVVQIRNLEEGDRVEIVLSPDQIERGCDKFYPNKGKGRIIAFPNHQIYSDNGTIVCISLDEPFERTVDGNGHPVEEPQLLTTVDILCCCIMREEETGDII